jgi:acyl carrier protein
MEERVRQILAEVLRVDSARVLPHTSPDNCPEWDSLKQVTLVMVLEEEFGVSFTIDEIEVMRTFSDVVSLVSAKI